MRRDRDFFLYVSVFVVFGAVVLWADDAPLAVAAIAAVIAGALLLLLLRGRRAPQVLLVGERPDAPVAVLHQALASAGYAIWTCAGPANSPCPVLMGRACPLRERPVAAVVVRRADETGPLPPCGRALYVPEIAVEEASDREPEIADGYARIGLERGAVAVVGTMERLVAA